MKCQNKIHAIVTKLKLSHEFKTYRTSFVWKKNSNTNNYMNKINLSGLTSKYPLISECGKKAGRNSLSLQNNIKYTNFPRTRSCCSQFYPTGSSSYLNLNKKRC